MAKLIQRVKHFSAITLAVIAASTASSPALADSEQILTRIEANTGATLNAVQSLPQYIQAGIGYFRAMMSKDDTTQTADMQKNFTQLYNDNATVANSTIDLQQPMLKDFFGPKITPQNLPSANDLVYQSLYGMLYFNPDPRATTNFKPNSPLEYVKNASGIRINHALPSYSWQGKDEHKQRYVGYYTSVSAVQTFNAYLMSQLYADYQNGHKLTGTQNTLMTQASSPDWFTQVGKENIGIVFRQILLYNSQMFVMLTRLLDVEKQILTAQAMTNTLLITLNAANEDILVKKAAGTIPD
jgi:hypothetical protein